MWTGIFVVILISAFVMLCVASSYKKQVEDAIKRVKSVELENKQYEKRFARFEEEKKQSNTQDTKRAEELLKLEDIISELQGKKMQLEKKLAYIEDLEGRIAELEEENEQLIAEKDKKEQSTPGTISTRSPLDRAANEKMLESIITKNSTSSKKTFVSLDFEYLYHSRYDTPCAVAMVKIVDNVIVGKYYTLIYQPKMPLRLAPNNGITPEMITSAPQYDKVYEDMVYFTAGFPIVAHNASTERKVLSDTPHPPHLPDLSNHYFIDTDALSGHRSLPTLCEEYGIPLNHHNALSDAEACAEVYLRLCGTQSIKEVVRKIHDTGKYASMHTEDRGDKDAYGSLPEDEWIANDSPYRGKNVCVTGKFIHYPDRDSLRIELKRLGAHISKNVAKSTNILLCGSLESAGPSKVEKIQAQGGIILFEEDVIPWVSSQV